MRKRARSAEEGMRLLSEYFSDETTEAIGENLPQEALEELLQVLEIVGRKMERYQERVKELDAR